MNTIIKKLFLCLLLTSLPANYLVAMQQEVAAAPQFEFHMPITSLTYLAARQAAELDKKTLQATIEKLYDKQAFLCKGQIKNYLTRLIDRHPQLMMDEQPELKQLTSQTIPLATDAAPHYTPKQYRLCWTDELSKLLSVFKQLTSQTIPLAATDATPHYAPRHYHLCWTDNLSKLLSVMLTHKVDTKPLGVENMYTFRTIDMNTFGIDEKKTDYAIHTNDTQLLSLALPKTSKPDKETQRYPLAEKTPIAIDAFYLLAQQAINLYHAPDTNDTPGSCAITAIEYLLAHARNIPQKALNNLLENAEKANLANLLIYGGIITHGNYHYAIEGGARGKFFDQWNNLPLHQAIVRGSLDAQERGKRAANDFDPAYLRPDATDSSSLGLVETNKIKFDARKRDEWWRAVEHDRFTAAKKFLSEHKEYDVNQRDAQGRTPLHLAAAYGNGELVKLLKEHKAEINAQDRYNYTPIHYAAKQGHTENVACLILNGADINSRTAGYWTPLHFAASYDHIETLSWLIQNGAYIGATTDMCRTPFSLTLINDDGFLESAKILLATEKVSIKELRATLALYCRNPEKRRIIEDALRHKQAKNTEG